MPNGDHDICRFAWEAAADVSKLADITLDRTIQLSVSSLGPDPSRDLGAVFAAFGELHDSGQHAKMISFAVLGKCFEFMHDAVDSELDYSQNAAGTAPNT